MNEINVLRDAAMTTIAKGAAMGTYSPAGSFAIAKLLEDLIAEIKGLRADLTEEN